MSQPACTKRAVRFLAACDSFKGTLSSFKVGEAIEAGYTRYAREACPDGARPLFTHCPMSDGGAGLLDSLTYDASQHTAGGSGGELSRALRLERVAVPTSVPITGPLGHPLPRETPVTFACDAEKGVVVVEMAEASGLPLIKDPRQRNPLRTTSYGTGEVIRYAVEYLRCAAPEAAKDGIVVYLGIGGSATNDGGLGALQALGLDVYVTGPSLSEERLSMPFCGADLARVTRVHVTDAMRTVFLSPMAFVGAVHVKVVYLICDVDNPLVGPRGATYTFGPQKCSPASADSTADGHNHEEVEDTAVGEVRGSTQRDILDALEAGMTHAAQRIAASLCTHDTTDCDVDATCRNPAMCANTLMHAAGGGGAGGMSGFFRLVLRARCLAGADAVARLLNLRIPVVSSGGSSAAPFTGLLYTHCDVLATGEGSFDSQTVLSHKTVGRLLEMAVEANIYNKLEHHTYLSQTSAKAHTEGDERLVKSVLVVCGRCGFPSPSLCQSQIEAALISTLLPALSTGSGTDHTQTSLERATAQLCTQSHGSSPVAVLKAAIPRIHVLPLAPHSFSVKEAMTSPFRCVQEAVYRFLKTCDCKEKRAAFACFTRRRGPTVSPPVLPASL